MTGRLTMYVLRAIVRPSVSSIEGVQVFDITIETFLREFATVLLQSQICEYSKPEPICVWHASMDVSFSFTSQAGEMIDSLLTSFH